MCRLILMTVGWLMILFGISGLWMMPKVIQQKIEQRLQLKIGTKTFDRFTKVPIPLTVKIYFFNITNSEQVLEGLERPKFEEVGPFMFKQWRRRDIVDFEDHNRRIRYREFKTFYSMYPPSQHNTSHTRSNISSSETMIDDNNNNLAHNNTNNINNNQHSNYINETHEMMLDPRNVNVTIINVPLLAVLSTLAKMEESSLKRKLASKITSRLIADGRDKILMTRPANQLLFDGTRVNFMDSTEDLISNVFGFNFESPLPNNRFGFFYLKNNTWNKRENGELTVYTGRNDSMSDYMIVDNWNDLKQLNVWPTNTVAGNRCNQIRGTDGSQFHPGVRRDQTLALFSPLVCTSLHVVYKEDTQVRDIPLLRFVTPPELFAAPRKNPRNACYCTVPAASDQYQAQYQAQYQRPASGRSPNDSRCYLDGLMDLSLCQRGAPIAASSPHFLNADPMLAMAAGLRPSKDAHQTYLDIEPMTGSVMRAASRAQINAYVEQSALEVIDSSIVGRMAPMVAPLFWLEEAAEIDEKSATMFKAQLLGTVQKVNRSCWYSIAIGLILVLAVSLQYWYVTCYSIDTESLRLDRKEKQAVRRQKLAAERAREDRRLRARARSNRENKSMLMEPEFVAAAAAATDGDDDDGQSSSDGGGGGTAKAALPVLAAALVLGAASAGPSSARKHHRRPRSVGVGRSAAAGEKPTERTEDDRDQDQDQDHERDEEELSTKMLVSHEYQPAGNAADGGRPAAGGAENQAASAEGAGGSSQGSSL